MNNIRYINYNLDYKYDYNKIVNNKISIYNEILRYKIINNLIKIFNKEIIKFKKNISHNKLNKIFKYNKLNELIQRWCWVQYNNNTILDDVIPYVNDNNYNYDEFLEDFNYILNTNITNDNAIIKSLKLKVKQYLYKYYKIYSNLIKESVNLKLTIKKLDKIIFIVEYNKDINIKLNIENDNNLKIKQIISYELYERLNMKIKKYFNDNFPEKKNVNYNIYIFCLVFRYSYIDSGNQQLAIDSRIKDLFKVYGVDFELFGSGINVVSNNYCSLFYDIEKYFGSKGNFYDINIYQGIYWCNPPYDDRIMTKTANKLINIMLTEKNIAFIITIPIWDNKTKAISFNDIIKDYNINSNADDHLDYQIYSLLKPYIKSELIIPKKRIPYFNYRLNTPIYAVDTYMLIVYHNIEGKYINNILSVFDTIIKLDKDDYFNIDLKKLN
jgi:hypothetical protein